MIGITIGINRSILHADCNAEQGRVNARQLGNVGRDAPLAATVAASFLGCGQCGSQVGRGGWALYHLHSSQSFSGRFFTRSLIEPL